MNGPPMFGEKNSIKCPCQSLPDARSIFSRILHTTCSGDVRRADERYSSVLPRVRLKRKPQKSSATAELFSILSPGALRTQVLQEYLDHSSAPR